MNSFILGSISGVFLGLAGYAIGLTGWRSLAFIVCMVLFVTLFVPSLK